MEVMAPGMVLEGFLMDPPESLFLFLHGLLWDFINRKATQGVTSLPYWYYWVLFLSWRVWGGIWMSSGLAYGAKPGHLFHSVQEGIILTTAWPCPTSRGCLLSHPFLPFSGWWEFWMGFKLRLGDLLLLPGNGLDLGCKFPCVSYGGFLGALI